MRGQHLYTALPEEQRQDEDTMVASAHWSMLRPPSVGPFVIRTAARSPLSSSHTGKCTSSTARSWAACQL